MEAPIIAISDKANLQVLCRSEDPGLFDTQGRQVSQKQRKMVAQFWRGGAPDWVIEEAQKRFKFQGRGDGEPIAMLIGVFDSAVAAKAHRWTEEEHDAVVCHLRDNENPKWIVVEQPKVPAPWPTYDRLVVQGQRTWEKVAAQNLETAEATGIPLESLVAYERQNRCDERILAAYEQAVREAEEALPADELVEA